jgi:hypothetical protein
MMRIEDSKLNALSLYVCPTETREKYFDEQAKAPQSLVDPRAVDVLMLNGPQGPNKLAAWRRTGKAANEMVIDAMAELVYPVLRVHPDTFAQIWAGNYILESLHQGRYIDTQFLGLAVNRCIVHTQYGYCLENVEDVFLMFAGMALTDEQLEAVKVNVMHSNDRNGIWRVNLPQDIIDQRYGKRGALRELIRRNGRIMYWPGMKRVPLPDWF